mmetsp:Transcript_33988/g.30769  ORF Transcript_33988/g.30769 Transcript_33988/m.30769 type:complete len:99 (-) Transcript_33988:4544-4840(-)
MCKLLSQVFFGFKTHKRCYEFIERVGHDLTESEFTYSELIEYLIVLKNLTVDQEKNNLPENQRRIMSFFMNKKSFLEALDFKFIDYNTNRTIRNEEEF